MRDDYSPKIFNLRHYENASFPGAIWSHFHLLKAFERQPANNYLTFIPYSILNGY